MGTSRQSGRNATTLLILWIVFLNSQLLFAITALFLWRISHRRVPLADAVLWDPAVVSGTTGSVMVGLAVALWFIGVWLRTGRPAPPVGFPSDPSASRERPPFPITPFLIKFALVESVGILGLALGLLHGNTVLALPFNAAAAIGMVVLLPAVNRARASS